MTLSEKLTAQGPKRILSLDGGGIRGVVTLGFLDRIEQILAERHPHIRDFRLCQYFDLIGGTSTGSIIAAALAIGMKVAEIKEKYLDLGGKIFASKKGIIKYLFNAEKYNSKPIKKELRNFFGEIYLGDQEAIRTGLCIVTKRADTFSTWPLINHPRGQFYQENMSIPLWQAVRASTAAPTYFIPEIVDVGPNEKGTFVDGGVSMANNPALQLFLLAVLKGYPFRWKTGSENLFLVSLGTGTSTKKYDFKEYDKASLMKWAATIPNLLMEDANYLNQMMLQYLSESPTARVIDGEVGDLSGDLLHGKAALSYVRYNVLLEQDHLKDLGLSYPSKKIEGFLEMDRAENRYELAKIGDAAGRKYVQSDHIPVSFNI
jgi:patatin-like phospholipase/acyl hydrolase